jgi:hypothetical protein
MTAARKILNETFEQVSGIAADKADALAIYTISRIEHLETLDPAEPGYWAAVEAEQANVRMRAVHLGVVLLDDAELWLRQVIFQGLITALRMIPAAG